MEISASIAFFVLVFTLLTVFISSEIIKFISYIFNWPKKYFQAKAIKPQLNLNDILIEDRIVKGYYSESCPEDKAYIIRHDYTALATFKCQLIDLHVNIENYYLYEKAKDQSWLRKLSIFAKYSCSFNEELLKEHFKKAVEHAYISHTKNQTFKSSLHNLDIRASVEISYSDIKEEPPKRSLKFEDDFCCSYC